jgi:hypothetical protein
MESVIATNQNEIKSNEKADRNKKLASAITAINYVGVF